MNSSVDKVKVLVIGPKNSGKSTIANLLAGRKQVTTKNYRPTVGCRILEFEKEAPQNPNLPGDQRVTIELWDVSGDQK